MFLFEGTTLHRLPSNQPQRLHKQLALRSVRICQQSVLSECHGASFCKVVLVELVRLHPQCGFQYYPFDNERQCYLRHNSYFGVSRPRYDCSVGQALKTVDIKSGFKKNRICYITRSAQLHLCNKLLNNKTNKPRTNTYSFRNKTLWRHGEITPRFENQLLASSYDMDCYIYLTKLTPQLYFATFLHTETSVTCSRFPSNNESKEVLSSSLLFYASKADRTLILQAMSRNNQATITITKKNFSKVLYDHTINPEIS